MNPRKTPTFPILCILLIFAVIFFPSRNIHARIVDTEHFTEILAAADSETLVLIDIDQTIAASTLTLGSQAWWDYQKHYFKRSGQDPKALETQFVPLIRQILPLVPIALVEPGIPAAIRSLQERGITVWGLTGRMIKSPWDEHYEKTTQAMLLDLSIDFTRSRGITPCDAPHFHYNILFTNWELKGPPLAALFKEIRFTPQKVVMIDDQMAHLVSVESALGELDIPFTGFHYTRMHPKEQAFDPLIGNIQLKYLVTEGKLLSEEEALRIKKANPSLGQNFFLDELLLQLKKECAILNP